MILLVLSINFNLLFFHVKNELEKEVPYVVFFGPFSEIPNFGVSQNSTESVTPYVDGFPKWTAPKSYP